MVYQWFTNGFASVYDGLQWFTMVYQWKGLPMERFTNGKVYQWFTYALWKGKFQIVNDATPMVYQWFTDGFASIYDGLQWSK